MRVKVRGAALLAAAVAALSGCTQNAVAAPVSVPSWHIVKKVSAGPNGIFTAVTAVGQNGGWAFDGLSRPTAWERSGSTWTQVPFPGLSDEEVVAAGASSATNVWAFTDRVGTSRALRWNGQHWTVVRSFSRAIGGAVVLSSSDVWVFGEPFVPGGGLGAWHYNGRSWTQVASGRGLEGGSGRSAGDVWAFDGADVAHWNGSAWSRTSLASFLPARQLLNDPALTGVFEQSRHSVYAIANGQLQDQGGPLVILHWNGSAWSKVAGRNFGFGGLQRVSSDGHGGLWLPWPGSVGGKSYVLHYTGGQLTQAVLPVDPARITLGALALIPGTSDVLGVGDTHNAADPGTGVVGVIAQYEM